jgi:hypothetical protein
MKQRQADSSSSWCSDEKVGCRDVFFCVGHWLTNLSSMAMAVLPLRGMLRTRPESRLRSSGRPASGSTRSLESLKTGWVTALPRTATVRHTSPSLRQISPLGLHLRQTPVSQFHHMKRTP